MPLLLGGFGRVGVFFGSWVSLSCLWISTLWLGETVEFRRRVEGLRGFIGSINPRAASMKGHCLLQRDLFF